MRTIQTRAGVPVYRQADAARRLKVTRQRIHQMILEGELHTVDEDGFRLVTSESLVAAQQRMNKLLKVSGRAG